MTRNVRAHALVIGYRREQLKERLIDKIPPAEIIGGRCIGCGCDVYVNIYGASAIRERDADVCCPRCESEYDADITRGMVES